jgi:hypothetical protein
MCEREFSALALGIAKMDDSEMDRPFLVRCLDAQQTVDHCTDIGFITSEERKQLRHLISQRIRGYEYRGVRPATAETSGGGRE